MPTPRVELQVGGRTVSVSSPDKLYFPAVGLTKLDLVHYVQGVGDGILAALCERPTTMERWPGGYREDAKLATRDDPRGDAFYQKRVPKNLPEWVQTATVTFPSGRTAVQACPTELATVVWMVNLGTLRFHPWPVRRTDTEAVDELRIDLDPQPGTEFADAVRAAHELRAVLADAGLSGMPKTSGGRGLHVFVPVRGVDFIAARHAVIALGRELARRLPAQVSVDWWKEQRGSRIFVDFNQMARDRTISSAYSIRPTPTARVSAPLRWEEIDDVEPDDFTVTSMPARFAAAGDAWAPYYAQLPGDLSTVLEWYGRDAANGEGEMPYPPDYPKMPGEPPRVQPSKKVAAHWDDRGQRIAEA